MELKIFKSSEREHRVEDREAIVDRMSVEHELSEGQTKILRLIARSAMTRKEKLEDLGVRPARSANGYGPEFPNPGPVQRS